MTSLKLFIYYASYLYFLAVPLLVWVLMRRQGRFSILPVKAAVGLLLTGISVLAWARFVEPRILLTREHDIEVCAAGEGTLRAAVWADPQTGMFGNVMPVTRVVRRINEVNPDITLIPGDFTYHMPTGDIAETFAPLAELRASAFAVMGNHDAGLQYGEDVIEPLSKELMQLGVRVLDGKNTDYLDGEKTIRIIGMRDHWTALRDRTSLAAPLPDTPADLTIALQHNPDVIRERRRLPDFDLMVAGHTHGGQLRVPFLTCRLTFACKVHRYGFVETRRGNLFVSSGTGLGGLPMRLAVPPVIDVLNIKYKRCDRRGAAESTAGTE